MHGHRSSLFSWFWLGHWELIQKYNLPWSLASYWSCCKVIYWSGCFDSCSSFCLKLLTFVSFQHALFIERCCFCCHIGRTPSLFLESFSEHASPPLCFNLEEVVYNTRILWLRKALCTILNAWENTVFPELGPNTLQREFAPFLSLPLWPDRIWSYKSDSLICNVPDKRVISAETFYHPMSKVWHSQDGGETTVMQGEWTTTHRGEPSHRRRRQLVHVVRWVRLWNKRDPRFKITKFFIWKRHPETNRVGFTVQTASRRATFIFTKISCVDSIYFLSRCAQGDLSVQKRLPAVLTKSVVIFLWLSSTATSA